MQICRVAIVKGRSPLMVPRDKAEKHEITTCGRIKRRQSKQDAHSSTIRTNYIKNNLKQLP